ncbi:MAG: hypothetical protein KR126chlam6_00575 [Candidatus Anoxychlamydiales bacterium]|nr:hypothetical protein [Candidatus Anoxychlamydiales bacterium]
MSVAGGAIPASAKALGEQAYLKAALRMDNNLRKLDKIIHLSNDGYEVLRKGALQKLDDILANAEARITFWGKRVITAEGYKGQYSLNSLFRKIINLAIERCEKENLTPVERLNGIRISEKISEFYEKTPIKNRNFLTRFFVSLRKIFSDLFLHVNSINYAEKMLKKYPNMGNPEKLSSISVDRFKNPNSIKDFFSAYSEQKYIDTFGKEATGLGTHYTNQIGTISESNKIIVSEYSIRNLAN